MKTDMYIQERIN